MTVHKLVLSLFAASALLSGAPRAAEPDKVLVKGKRDPSTIVIKGVRDPSDWFRLESPHLIVYSNDEPDDVIELVNNIERLDAILRLYLKPFMVPRDATAKLTLYFQRRPHWPAELGEHSADAVAMVGQCVAASQMFTTDVGASWKLDNAALLRAENDYTLMWNLVMYAENFLYRHTRIRSPNWFTTGFGAYFGGLRFTDNQMAIGRDAGTSYDLLQLIDNGGRPAGLSTTDVLRFKRESSDRQVGSPGYFRHYEFLSRSFNLVHYVLSSEANRDKTMQYLESVNSGADPATAFESLFGLAGRDLDIAMWRYRQSAQKILQIDVPELPRPKVEFTRLSRLEGEFVLDNAALKNCPSPADGKQLLARVARAAAAAPAVPFAQLTLHRAQIEWGDPRDAIGYLAHALEDDPTNVELLYLLGQAHAKLGDRAAARAALTQAAVLAPDAPEVAYALFGLGLAEARPAAQDIARATAAWRHRHDAPAITRAAALAYAWLGDAPNAYQAFNTLVRDENNGHDAAWAVGWLARLETGVDRDELLAAMRTEVATATSSRVWLSH